jgi:hypothetical protein
MSILKENNKGQKDMPHPILDNPKIMSKCYGVSLDTKSGSGATLKRIGNTKLHEQLPVQNSMIDVTLNGDSFIGVTPFYFTQFFSDGIYYWLISTWELEGFELHPWFFHSEEKIPIQYFGVHMASIDENGELRSVPGKVTTNKTDIVPKNWTVT